jgi:hypothetical protein
MDNPDALLHTKRTQQKMITTNLPSTVCTDFKGIRALAMISDHSELSSNIESLILRCASLIEMDSMDTSVYLTFLTSPAQQSFFVNP